MGEPLELNRLEFNILKGLYENGCTDQYRLMTITELSTRDWLFLYGKKRKWRL